MMRQEQAEAIRSTGSYCDPAEQQYVPETPLLQVRALYTTFYTQSGAVHAVNGLDFEVKKGERVAVVGESGSGKSAAALSILRLVKGARIEGEILFRGQDLLRLSAREMRAIRGTHIALILQDPLSSLNPVMTVGDQIVETLRARGISRKEARRRAIELLERVGVGNASRRLSDYPHQFSGGMRQRVVIAIGLIGEPELLIADEPTTALDVRAQAQVLDLLQELAEERHMAVLLITHDLGIVAGFAQRVIVMYAGRAIEQGSTEAIFHGTTHPYTFGLLSSLPRIDGPLLARLPTIGGQPPSPLRIPSGCAFYPRCAYARPICSVETPSLIIHDGDDHPSACHFAGSLRLPKYLGSLAEGNNG